MNKKLGCIMLIDDNQDDNFFHEREIKKIDLKCVVLTKNSGLEALEYLKSKKEPRADLIFLDINMPAISGWDCLTQIKKKNEGCKNICQLPTSFWLLRPTITLHKHSQ